MLTSRPWRSLAAYCCVPGDMRSIAPILLVLGRAEPRDLLESCRRARTIGFPTVSAVCDCRNEREHPAKTAAAECGSEWSGRKADESGVVRGRNRAETWQGVGGLVEAL